jgi:5-amino-6-(5-phospho-D-ribitylamino)uracil phosphatase
MFSGVCERCGDTPRATPAVLAVDLDDTLVTPLNRMHKGSRETLLALVESGVVVTIATGRPLHDALLWAGEIGARYVIPYNGAALVEADGTVLWTAASIPEQVIAAVIPVADKHGVSVHLHTADGWYPIEVTDLTREYAEHHRLTATLGVRPSGSVLLLELLGMPKALGQLLSEAPELDDLKVTASRNLISAYLDVVSNGTSKAVALERLLSLLGHDWSAVLALGDGANDVEMLGAAGLSVAVAGAHIDVLRKVTHRIDLTAAEGAVHTALSGLLLQDTDAAPLISCCHRRRITADGAAPRR